MAGQVREKRGKNPRLNCFEVVNKLFPYYLGNEKKIYETNSSFANKFNKIPRTKAYIKKVTGMGDLKK
jgi:hypothetical protein